MRKTEISRDRFALLRSKIATAHEDGRWIGAALEIPGTWFYAATELEAVQFVCRLLVRVEREKK